MDCVKLTKTCIARHGTFLSRVYTRAADVGGFNVADFPGISAWLERVTQQPGYVSMSDDS
jgi:hypothetical protein